MGLTQRDEDADQLRAEDEAIATAGRAAPYRWTDQGVIDAGPERADLAELIALLTQDEATPESAVLQDDQGRSGGDGGGRGPNGHGPGDGDPADHSRQVVASTEVA